MIARPPASAEATQAASEAPALTKSDAPTPTCRPGDALTAASTPTEQIDPTREAFAKLCPHTALRTFGLLGLGIVIALTFLLELMSYTGALGMVVELFDRLRLIVTVASTVALCCLVTIALRHHHKKAGWVPQKARSR